MRIVEPIIRVGLALVHHSWEVKREGKNWQGIETHTCGTVRWQVQSGNIGTRPCIIVAVVHLWIVIMIFSPVAVVVVGLWHHRRSSPVAIIDEAIYLSPPPLSSPLFRHCDRLLVVILLLPQSYFHIVEPRVVDLVVEVIRVRCAGLALFCRCLCG